MSKFHSKILSITQQSWALFQRMAARSVGLAMLTFLGFALVDFMIDQGISDRFALVRRFPEFIPLMLAAAKLTFIEMSVFWIRFATQPALTDSKLAISQVLENAYSNPTAVVIFHGINSAMWGFRIAVLLYLAQ